MTHDKHKHTKEILERYLGKGFTNPKTLARIIGAMCDGNPDLIKRFIEGGQALEGTIHELGEHYATTPYPWHEANDLQTMACFNMFAMSSELCQALGFKKDSKQAGVIFRTMGMAHVMYGAAIHMLEVAQEEHARLERLKPAIDPSEVMKP